MAADRDALLRPRSSSRRSPRCSTRRWQAARCSRRRTGGISTSRAAPVDARSAQLIDFISGRTATNRTPVRHLHPDFGPPPYGIPYVVVAGDQPRVTLALGAYGDESDTGAPGSARLSDSGRSADDRELHRRRGGRRRRVRGPAHARGRPRSMAALRDLRNPLERGAGTVGSRFRGRVRPVTERSTAGWLDVGGCGGAGDLSRAWCDTTRCSVLRRSPTRSA